MPQDTAAPEKAIISFIDRLGLDPVITLPCNYTASLIEAIQGQSQWRHVPCSREEEGVGIACGAYLGGKRPVMIFQNSGLGNAVNALASLSKLYRIPLVMLLSHRGTSGERIVAQKPMGELAPVLLKALDIDICEISTPGDLSQHIGRVDANWENNKSTALLLPISYWTEKRLSSLFTGQK